MKDGDVLDLNEYAKQESLKLQLKMIFGDTVQEFTYANSNHIKIVCMYGKTGLSFAESLEASIWHLEVSMMFARVGIPKDSDHLILDLITLK